MIRFATSVVLVAAMAAQILSKTLVLAGFVVNRDYIATVLCENTAKPEKHCNGKCQLAKRLQQEERKERLPSSPLKEKMELPSAPGAMIRFKIYPLGPNEFSFYDQPLPYTSFPALAVFHPPQV
jgi:hypothetical protein